MAGLGFPTTFARRLALVAKPTGSPGRGFVLDSDVKQACALTTRSMHYERAPLLQKIEGWCGAASAPLRRVGASLRCGGARGKRSGVSGEKLEEGYTEDSSLADSGW